VFDTFWQNGQDLPAKMLIGQMPKLSRSSDYTGKAVAVVNTVTLLLLRFVLYRMDTTFGNDHTGGYLFKDYEKTAYFAKTAEDKRDQLEKALQLDCVHRLQAYLGQNVKIELSDVSSGRVDIAIETNGLRFSIEVKREDTDASHEALLRKYGAQGTEYSNTNIRIGFLLVLDRSRPDGSAGYLSDKFSVQEVMKKGETEPRLLVIVTMPGRRKTPSAQGPLQKEDARAKP